jgi:CRP/FNR family transcriptional regulator
MEDLALDSVRSRLAHSLLSLAVSDSAPVRFWTLGELATQIGTVRDVVGRTMRRFARLGLIRCERSRVVVMDVAGLRREALGNQTSLQRNSFPREIAQSRE